MIPYICPEFIAAVLGNESAVATDLQTNSRSALRESVSVARSQSGATASHAPGPLRWNVSWSRCSRLFAVVAKLIVLWFV